MSVGCLTWWLGCWCPPPSRGRTPLGAPLPPAPKPRPPPVSWPTRWRSWPTPPPALCGVCADLRWNLGFPRPPSSCHATRRIEKGTVWCLNHSSRRAVVPLAALGKQVRAWACGPCATPHRPKAGRHGLPHSPPALTPLLRSLLDNIACRSVVMSLASLARHNSTGLLVIDTLLTPT